MYMGTLMIHLFLSQECNSWGFNLCQIEARFNSSSFHRAKEQIQYLECLLQKKGQSRQVDPSPRTAAPHVPSWGTPGSAMGHDQQQSKHVLRWKVFSWEHAAVECLYLENADMWYHLTFSFHFFKWHELTCYNVAGAFASRAWGPCQPCGAQPNHPATFGRKLGPAVPQER